MSAAAKDAMRAQMGTCKKAAACLLLLRAPGPPRVFFFLRPYPPSKTFRLLVRARGHT